VSRGKYARFRDRGTKVEFLNEKALRKRVCPGAYRQAALREQLSKYGFERDGHLYAHALFRVDSDSWKQILSKRQKEAQKEAPEQPAAAKASEKTSGALPARKRAAST
jgi:hypothetical protein